MDCLIFTAVSQAVAEKRRPEAVINKENEYDHLGPAERRVQTRRRKRRRRRQSERWMRRLTASGLQPGQVREMEEAVRRSQMILRQPPEPVPLPVCAGDLAILSVGSLGATSGVLVAGWVGWAVLLVGAVIVMVYSAALCVDDHRRREEEAEKRAPAKAELASVRAVLERTGNADLLPLHDW